MAVLPEHQHRLALLRLFGHEPLRLGQQIERRRALAVVAEPRNLRPWRRNLEDGRRCQAKAHRHDHRESASRCVGPAPVPIGVREPLERGPGEERERETPGREQSDHGDCVRAPHVVDPRGESEAAREREEARQGTIARARSVTDRGQYQCAGEAEVDDQVKPQGRHWLEAEALRPEKTRVVGEQVRARERSAAHQRDSHHERGRAANTGSEPSDELDRSGSGDLRRRPDQQGEERRQESRAPKLGVVEEGEAGDPKRINGARGESPRR